MSSPRVTGRLPQAQRTGFRNDKKYGIGDPGYKKRKTFVVTCTVTCTVFVRLFVRSFLIIVIFPLAPAHG